MTKLANPHSRQSDKLHDRPLSDEESHDVPLCVDLDGTLLRSDMLYESLLCLVRRNPLYLFLVPLWLAKGRAHLKHQIALRGVVDVALLPYDRRVLSLLSNTKGRDRILCTASNYSIAHKISEHLGVFEGVMASTAATNLSGDNKANELLRHFGPKGFDYVGNTAIDLKIWCHARQAWIVNGTRSLVQAASTVTEVAGHIPRESRRAAAAVKALRPHQWLKNLLLVVPLLAAHLWNSTDALYSVTLAIVSFSLCASAVYVINDLLDLPSDRAHPRKCKRPFASGDLPIICGVLLAPLLLSLSALIAARCGPLFFTTITLYFCATLAYSMRLKAIAIIDVLVLAGLYTIRVVAGAVVVQVPLSFWLLAFIIFLFLSLASLKRCVELFHLSKRGVSQAAGRGYVVNDLPLLRNLGTTSGYVSVLVLALYINSPTSVVLYDNQELLWLLCPILLYWISRTWLLGHRGEMNDDPVVYAATDRVSQALLVLCAAIGLLAL